LSLLQKLILHYLSAEDQLTDRRQYPRNPVAAGKTGDLDGPFGDSKSNICRDLGQQRSKGTRDVQYHNHDDGAIKDRAEEVTLCQRRDHSNKESGRRKISCWQGIITRKNSSQEKRNRDEDDRSRNRDRMANQNS
jgi:hypothetical protein